MKTNSPRMLLGGLLILGAALLLLQIARFPHKYQWDFQTYYYASLAFSERGNPYDLDEISARAESPITLRFMYPPHVLPLLSWTPLLTYSQAHIAWLGMKGVSLVLLLGVWTVFLARQKPGVLFFALAALAFNGAIVSDLISGNVAIVEQLFLWAGFLAFVRDRSVLFALLIAAASFFKVTNAFFLLLLPFAPPGRRTAAFIAGGVATAVPLLFSALRWPDLFRAFLANANVIGDPLERGAKNPCLSAFLLSLADVIRDLSGWEVPMPVVLLVFALHAVAALVLTAFLLRRSALLPAGERGLAAISLACLVYPLVVPRFKNYAFIQLIPPAYLLLRRLGKGTLEVALLAFIVAVPTFTLLEEMQPLAEYYLFFVSYALWIWMMVIVREGVREAPAAT